MTLRQLFSKIPFDSIVPFIKKEKESGSVCAYKEAYDILLHTAPAEEGWQTIEASLCTDNDRGRKGIFGNMIIRNCTIFLFQSLKHVFQGSELVFQALKQKNTYRRKTTGDMMK